MVEAYIKVMNPPPGLIEGIVKESSDPQSKWKTLEEARNRAEWERGRRKRENEQAKEKEEETKAMAIIDWQDFVVVETIEFTQNDMELDLPSTDIIREAQVDEYGREENGFDGHGGDRCWTGRR